MKWKIISVGKPALPWAAAAVEDYLHRLRRMAQVEMIVVKQGSPSQVARRALESSEGAWRILLDEHGRQLASADFARWIAKQELGGRKCVALLIGGADGHPPEIREVADEVWSLSTMTLQHELALVVLMEQFYRACSILRGEPYHRP